MSRIAMRYNATKDFIVIFAFFVVGIAAIVALGLFVFDDEQTMFDQTTEDGVKYRCDAGHGTYLMNGKEITIPYDWRCVDNTEWGPN